MKHHLDYLSQELVRRKERNTRYSLRAFAAQIGLHPSALSRVLAGKQVLSTAAGTEIVKRLNMERDHARVFLRSILEDRLRLEEKKLGEVLEGLAPTSEPSPSDEAPSRAQYSKTIEIDPAKVPEANRRIADFIEGLSDFLKTGERKELYEIGVQFVPLRGTQEIGTPKPIT